jgi:hypothetical protein
MMRVFRFLAGGLLLPGVIVTTVWFSAPWWLARVAEYELTKLGFDHITLAIEHVGLHQSRMSGLHLKQEGGTLEIDAGNATLSYNIPALLRRQIDSLKLETLDVELHPSRQTQGASGLILLSPATLFSAIPVSRIDVERITLRRFDADNQTVQELSGKASYSDRALHLNLGESDRQGVQAMLSLSEAGSCEARLSRGDTEIVRTECQLTQQKSRTVLQGLLHADLAALDDLLSVWVAMPEHRLSGTMQLTWTAELPAQVDTGRLREDLHFETSFDVDADIEAKPQPYRLLLKGKVGYAGGKATWSIADDSLVRFGEKLRSRLSFAGISGEGSLGEQWELSLAKGGELLFRDLTSGEPTAPQVNLKLLRPLLLSISDDADLLLSQPAEIEILADRGGWQNNSLISRDIKLNLKAGKLMSPVGSMLVDDLRLESNAVSVPPGTLALDFDLSRDPLTAKGRLSARDGSMDVDWNLSHSMKQNAGRMSFTAVPLQFPAAGPVLAGLLGQREVLNLQGGTLGCKGQMQWSGKQPFAGDIRLGLQNLKGAFQTTTFSGLNGDMQITVDARALNMSSKALSAQMLDVGLPLAHVSMQTSVHYPFKGKVRAVLKEVKAEAFGGLISSKKIDIDTGRKSNPFVVRLEHIDASALVEFRKQEGLFAEGLLDGTLPFDWTDKGLTLTAGILDARVPGGLIRYLGTASMQQIAATDKFGGMAMQILNDFHFRVLHTQADYQPDGELALRIELKGNNPGYENGRQIEFNLNIEENVLKLLQSLRTVGEISDRIEKSIQKKK